jgi:hypothetical protein
MRTCVILSAILALTCGLGYTQDKKQAQPAKTEQKAEEKAAGNDGDKFSPLAVSTDLFSVSMPTFTKKVDFKGRGEVMEIVFEIVNVDETPREIYVFVLATYETPRWKYNSFGTKKMIADKTAIDLFVPVPGPNSNFEFDVNGAKTVMKYAKDFKLGVDPVAKKAYTLKDKIVIRTDHLSLYRKNYKFFNNAAVLVYDDEGKVLYRQLYLIDKTRKR